MRIRESKKRVRVSVHGPRVPGVVTPYQVETYLQETGWISIFASDEGEPAAKADWYDAKPRRFWTNRWAQDLPLGYDRERSPMSLPSPYYRRVKLGDLIDMLGEVEGRPPSEVLADITRVK